MKLFVCFAALLAVAAAGSGSKEELNLEFQVALGELIPSHDEERVCLNKEAEMALCSGGAYIAEFNLFMGECASETMAMFAEFEFDEDEESENCELNFYLKTVLEIKTCVFKKMGWISVEGEMTAAARSGSMEEALAMELLEKFTASFGVLVYENVEASLAMTPLEMIFEGGAAAIVEECKAFELMIVDIETLKIAIEFIFEIELSYEIEEYDWTFGLAAGTAAGTARTGYDRKGSKSGSKSASAYSKSKSSSSSSSSSSEELDIMLTIIAGMPEEIVIMIAQRMAFFGCIEAHYVEACTVHLHEFIYEKLAEEAAGTATGTAAGPATGRRR